MHGERQQGGNGLRAISLIEIDFSFGDRKILERISFEVGAGEFVCLLGQSGRGKSTLLPGIKILTERR
jgi:ABC-type sugar transport system ATPase subunit